MGLSRRVAISPCPTLHRNGIQLLRSGRSRVRPVRNSIPAGAVGGRIIRVRECRCVSSRLPGRGAVCGSPHSRLARGRAGGCRAEPCARHPAHATDRTRGLRAWERTPSDRTHTLRKAPGEQPEPEPADPRHRPRGLPRIGQDHLAQPSAQSRPRHPDRGHRQRLRFHRDRRDDGGRATRRLDRLARQRLPVLRRGRERTRPLPGPAHPARRSPRRHRHRGERPRRTPGTREDAARQREPADRVRGLGRGGGRGRVRHHPREAPRDRTALGHRRPGRAQQDGPGGRGGPGPAAHGARGSGRGGPGRVRQGRPGAVLRPQTPSRNGSANSPSTTSSTTCPAGSCGDGTVRAGTATESARGVGAAAICMPGTSPSRSPRTCRWTRAV